MAKFNNKFSSCSGFEIAAKMNIICFGALLNRNFNPSELENTLYSF